MERRLSEDEDRDLRRLALLASYGSLAEDAAARFAELRGRDRRIEVREPEDLVMPAPRQHVDGPLAVDG
jgi:hypothetical protein